MTSLSPDKLAEAILEFSKRDRSILFTGAGVGKKVGFPLWTEYIEYLATTCAEHGAVPEAGLIRDWASEGRLIDAAGIYAKTSKIIIGERWRLLAAPFNVGKAAEELKPLSHLFELPFDAVVTTNYDRSQHAAYSLIKHPPALQIEREGTSMIAAAQHTSFFVARIHGSAEAPKSMVLYPETYDSLRTNETYQDFLLTVFRTRPCLFVGFSFVDPAINFILHIYERKAQELFHVPHAALLPSEKAAQELGERLSKLNIEVHFYDPEDGHKALWKAFRRASAEFSRKPVESKQQAQETPASVGFRRFLSFTYAQVKLSKEFQPLLQQAREGIILGIIQESGENGATHDEIVSALREALTLDQQEATRIASAGTSELFRERQIRVQNERLFAQKRPPSALEQSLVALSSGVLDRLKVRFDVSPSKEDATLVRDALEHVFMVRAWDLGAHYAGGGGGYGEDISSIVRDRLNRQAKTASATRVNLLGSACVDLLRFPTNQETVHLAEISRAAFSLQLVLASPRQSLFKLYVLPQRVYFDASVLLPAIVPGHPFHALFRETIDHLLKAAQQLGVDCRLCVGSPFLNEVISHRERAVHLAEALKVDNSEELKRTVLAFGAENLNVFIGGFAGVTSLREKSKQKRISFHQFLRDYAPYATEEALHAYIRKAGFEIVPMDFRHDHNTAFVRLFNGLLTGYETLKDDIVRGKERVLVEHEAVQLVQMSVDRKAGLRSVFVSNDRKLRRAAESESATKVHASEILPPQGFIGLVDIVVGSRPDPRGLARLIWASSRRETDQILRDYLVRRALLEQDVAQAKASAEVIDEIIAEAKATLKIKPVDLSDTASVESIAAAVDFIDRFEDRFFEKMRRAIERQER